MQIPRRLIPPVSGLIAFEATARHRSFSRAAEDLALSQGAVSKRVRQLEEVLGVVLISRGGHPLHLTRFGRSYLPRVQNLLSQMERSTRDLLHEAQGAPKTVTIRLDSAFAMGFLLPRLGEFNRTRPDVSINLLSQEGQEKPEIEITVRCGHLASAGPGETVLCPEDLIAVAGPGIRSGDRDADVIMRQALLHLASRPALWDDWLAGAGMRREASSDGPTFDHVSLLIAAAANGQGIALLPRVLVHSDLFSGRLRQLVVRGASDSAYILRVRQEAVGLPHVEAFRHWLVDSFGRARQPGHAANGEAAAPETAACLRISA